MVDKLEKFNIQGTFLMVGQIFLMVSFCLEKVRAFQGLNSYLGGGVGTEPQ